MFGATYLVMAPEHPLVDALTAGCMAGRDRPPVDGRPPLPRSKRSPPTGRGPRPVRSGNGRPRPGEKTGVFTGSYAVNPATGRADPVFIADYVLPGLRHRRDHGGARPGRAGLGVRRRPSACRSSAPCSPATGWLAETGYGEPAVTYRLRDWLLSRQRYWGCPIPIVYCDSCGTVPVPEDSCRSGCPTWTTTRPEAGRRWPRAEGWVTTPLPGCGGARRRETDTMDTFVDSSWYYLRYCDPHNDAAAWSADAMAAWMPADQYIGGVEHAILHLLYARFLVKALADLGHLTVPGAVHQLFGQGMITKDGAKVSKSKGNSVSPQAIIERYGADAARCYILFIGPPRQDAEWSDRGIEGVLPVPAPAVAADRRGQGGGRRGLERGRRPGRNMTWPCGALARRRSARSPRHQRRVRLQHRDRRADEAAERVRHGDQGRRQQPRWPPKRWPRWPHCCSRSRRTWPARCTTS